LFLRRGYLTEWLQNISKSKIKLIFMEELLNKTKQRISNAESQRRVKTAHGTKDLPLRNKREP
jgi:hypothetical protein